MSTFTYATKDRPAALLKYDAKAGEGTALFSRFDVIDRDGNVTRASFLPDGVVVPLLVAHKWDQLPSGKARIRVERDAAYADFTLADSRQGQALAEWLRFDFSDGQPKSEWSYGFAIKPGGSSRGVFEGQNVRFLHGLETGEPGAVVKEISYVLAGAGIETALIDMKAMQNYRWARRHRELQAITAEREREQQRQAEGFYQRFIERERWLVRKGW
jgi:hypothetical protein